MTPKYPIPLDEALRRLADGDPVECMFQPHVGNVNEIRRCTRQLAIRTLSRWRWIEESGPEAQAMDFGIHVTGYFEVFGAGLLFFKTKPERRVSEARLRAREAAEES
ncbi:MAG TPA: hypothetical protein VK797_22690 [Tepidisphaeraceae bacterium]|jgi:hypothetical protein|nr:hypothetical protein [Tepidisphaeraceae bacterium]